MQRSTHVFAFRLTLSLALIFATVVVLAQTQRSAAKPADHALKQAAGAPSSSVQSYRNVGKAYFEQGKYVEAIEQFQKVVASGKAQAADHLSLGMALMSHRAGPVTKVCV